MLRDVKVYVGKHSKEIQEKSFALGWKWINSPDKEVKNLTAPFLYFDDNNFISYGDNVVNFNRKPFKELTAEEILAMEVPKPKKSCKELGEVNGYYINEDGEILNFRKCNPNFDISDFDDGYHFDILPTKEEAEAYKILPFLLQWRDRYNEGWKPKWKDSEKCKYVLRYYNGDIEKDASFLAQKLFAFKTPEIRDRFLEDFREELEIVKPLL